MRTVHGSDYPLKPVQRVSLVDAPAASPPAEVKEATGQEEIKSKTSVPAAARETLMFEEMSHPVEVQYHQFTPIEVERKDATSYLVCLQPDTLARVFPPGLPRDVGQPELDMLPHVSPQRLDAQPNHFPQDQFQL